MRILKRRREVIQRVRARIYEILSELMLMLVLMVCTAAQNLIW
jgi:hypothetical protein